MPSIDFEIRDATLQDLPVLLNFEQEIIKAERPFNCTLREDPINYYDLEKMIGDEDAKVIVAVTDGKIIASGYAIPKKASDFFKHEYYAYLGFMFTDPDFRGMGVNAEIIKALKSWSYDQGLHEIRLTVYEDNIPAIKAYEKVGFRKLLVEMRLE